MILTVYAKKLDHNQIPVVTIYPGIRKILFLDGEISFEMFRPFKSDFRPYRIKDYFYFTIDNDPSDEECAQDL